MKKIVFIGLSISVFLAIFLSPFASSWSDGLEKVAEDKGFMSKGEGEPIIAAPVPDYEMPGIKNDKVATSLAGILGTLVTFLGAYLLGFVLKRRKQKE